MEGVLAILGVGERLYEPELAMFDKLGVETASSDLACVAVEGARENEEIVAHTLMGGV